MILNRCPKHSPGEGIRTVPPAATIERVLPLLPLMGMDEPEEITASDDVGIPVFSIGRPDAPAGRFYNGKGPTAEQALASGLMEAAERYSAERRETDEVVYGTYDQAVGVGLTVNPQDLILPVNTLSYYRSAEIAWTEGYELLRGEPVWIPSCAVFYPYRGDSDLQLFGYHTNGLATGNTLEEAVLHSLLELIERDAWTIAEERGTPGTDVTVDPDSVPGRLLRRFADAGVEVRLRDLTSDVGITTIGAAADDVRTRDPEMLTVGAGTHLDPAIACVRAITEVAQSRATHRHGRKIDAKRRQDALDLGYERMKEMNRLWYGESGRSVRLEDLPQLATPYVLDDIEVVLDRLVATGFDMVAVADLTRGEIGVPCVRCVVPGLEVATMDPSRIGARARGLPFRR